MKKITGDNYYPPNLIGLFGGGLWTNTVMLVLLHIGPYAVHLHNWLKGRKHEALRAQKPLRHIRDGDVGGSGIFISNTYSLHCHQQNDSALRRAAV